ncbi:hypothetical protein GCM10011391_13990 [Pullulanibacillus camelliae]|uniref:Transposase n=1 Tax=Pullulanibacillus camelliae TaxID=1707096 RepID=A0A8J2VNX0_9BACL|nr:hypothetical protein GCM10011391_13990 [Pullulanibacillus camelliae]
MEKGRQGIRKKTKSHERTFLKSWAHIQAGENILKIGKLYNTVNNGGIL